MPDGLTSTANEGEESLDDGSPLYLMGQIPQDGFKDNPDTVAVFCDRKFHSFLTLEEYGLLADESEGKKYESVPDCTGGSAMSVEEFAAGFGVAVNENGVTEPIRLKFFQMLASK